MKHKHPGNLRNWPKWKRVVNGVRNGRKYGHRWTDEEAKAAGRKGGLVRAAQVKKAKRLKMRPLTSDQAVKLRYVRRYVKELTSAAEKVYSELSSGCEHDPPNEEECCICALTSMVGDIEPIAGRLAICVDSALEGKEFSA